MCNHWYSELPRSFYVRANTAWGSINGQTINRNRCNNTALPPLGRIPRLIRVLPAITVIESARSRLVKERIDKCACTSRSCARFCVHYACMRCRVTMQAQARPPFSHSRPTSFLSLFVPLFPFHFFPSLSRFSTRTRPLFYAFRTMFCYGIVRARVSLCFLELKRRVY